jgi:hypothetical protein
VAKPFNVKRLNAALIVYLVRAVKGLAVVKSRNVMLRGYEHTSCFLSRLKNEKIKLSMFSKLSNVIKCSVTVP